MFNNNIMQSYLLFASVNAVQSTVEEVSTLLALTSIISVPAFRSNSHSFSARAERKE